MKLDYNFFLKSLEQNKIHNLSRALIEPPDFKVSEPHYLLSTSGSNYRKHFIFSLSHLQFSSQAFLSHFKFDKNNRWLISLPTHHVAGFSILVRSYFGDFKEPIFLEKWNAKEAVELIDKYKVTLMSLVPSQVFDLVQLNLKAPKSLVAVFIGGASCPQVLIERAKELGWPLIFCYGMTETFAQFSSSVDGKNYKPYKGWNVALSEEKELLIKSLGLFDYEYKDKWLKRDETKFFNTKDLVANFSEEGFTLNGRKEDLFKIKGAYFDFKGFKSRFTDFMVKEGFSLKSHLLILAEDLRSGGELFLVSNNLNEANKLMQCFERIKGVYIFKSLDWCQTSLGKINKPSLQGVLGVQILSC